MTPLQSLAAELGAAHWLARLDNTGATWTHARVADELDTACGHVKALLARLGELEAERAETYATMNHAHIFIYTREKMHPDGRLLYEDLLRRLAPSPKPEE